MRELGEEITQAPEAGSTRWWSSWTAAGTWVTNVKRHLRRHGRSAAVVGLDRRGTRDRAQGAGAQAVHPPPHLVE